MISKPVIPQARDLSQTAKDVDIDAERELEELHACLYKLGKIMLASSSSVGKVKATIEDIAAVFGYKSEIVALPNVLIIKLGNTNTSSVDLTTQTPSSLQLNQAANLSNLVDDLLERRISPADASRGIDKILAQKPRFGAPLILFGYILAVMGMTLRLQMGLEIMLISALLGLLSGLIMNGLRRFPRLELFAPILAAVAVSVPTFMLANNGRIIEPINLIIPALMAFLPGAIMTTAMIELASADIISGSSRLIYGFFSLMLLYVGIGAGAQIVDLSAVAISDVAGAETPLWAALLGTTMFGVGNFIRLSGRNRDLLWILIVLFGAMFGQMIGEFYINSLFGAFLGAFVLAVSSEMIGRSGERTPAFVSQTLAFWFLVPGARALLSVTHLLDSDNIYMVGNFDMNELFLLIVYISLGILLGTILTTPGRKQRQARKSPAHP